MKLLYVLFISFLIGVACVSAQTRGCTDPGAQNYNPQATVNDGSCVYSPATVTPTASVQLPAALAESSGLIFWKNHLLTHNDDTDNSLYSVDTITGQLFEKQTLTGVKNTEWEEISQDDSSIYLGDFGNNSRGNRRDLHLLRVNKASLLTGGSIIIDTINFSYSDQTSFTDTGNDNTDFDCEAFIVSRDSIYLFTKQWVSGKTGVYSLPKIPGNHTAQLQFTLPVDGLITGATYREADRLIALCGYSTLLQPFLYLLYDFTGMDFTTGNKRKLSLGLPFHQIEGIATHDGLTYYLTNEYFSKPPFVTTPQKLHRLDLKAFTGTYLDAQTSGVWENTPQHYGVIYPNPAYDEITVTTAAHDAPVPYSLCTLLGRVIRSGELPPDDSRISTRGLSAGMYLLSIGFRHVYALTVIQ
ncbi:MAG: T9SS type A sorting domain-containing protein [Candidatus Kapaibacterium sp.]